jgi:hypothetical protein
MGYISAFSFKAVTLSLQCLWGSQERKGKEKPHLTIFPDYIGFISQVRVGYAVVTNNFKVILSYKITKAIIL